MTINCVMFDLDGVLVDACDWHYHALNRALLDVCSFEISRHDHETKYNGLPTNVKLKMLGIDDSLSTEINNLKQHYTMDCIRQNANIMHEKILLHQYLKNQGVKIACVTNSIRMTATEMLFRTGQMEYIDLLVSNEDVKNNKPSPDCYEYAMSVLGVDPLCCVCVEDSPKGLQAAKASSAAHVWEVRDTYDVTVYNYRRFVNEDSHTNGR